MVDIEHKHYIGIMIQEADECLLFFKYNFTLNFTMFTETYITRDLNLYSFYRENTAYNTACCDLYICDQCHRCRTKILPSPQQFGASAVSHWAEA